jgi:hypothetical protein
LSLSESAFALLWLSEASQRKVISSCPLYCRVARRWPRVKSALPVLGDPGLAHRDPDRAPPEMGDIHQHPNMAAQRWGGAQTLVAVPSGSVS